MRREYNNNYITITTPNQVFDSGLVGSCMATVLRIQLDSKRGKISPSIAYVEGLIIDMGFWAKSLQT